MRIGPFPHQGQLQAVWHVPCIPGVAWVLQLQHAFLFYMGLVVAWVLQGCNLCSIEVRHGFCKAATSVPQGTLVLWHGFCNVHVRSFCFTCVLLFVFHFICFFWYGSCFDPGGQHLPILTMCLTCVILLFQLIKQDTFDTP